MSVSAISSGSVQQYGYSSQTTGSVRGQDQENASRQEEELTDDEKREVEELEKQDKEVRAHEMAHVAAGGQYIRGGASFEYESGPDGKKYAVGGEVSIDTSPVSGDPRATMQKMQVVRKAALAPANPSAQDRAIAAKASQELTKAQMELVKEESKQGGESGPPEGGQGKPSASIGATYSSGGKLDAATVPGAALLDLIG